MVEMKEMVEMKKAVKKVDKVANESYNKSLNHFRIVL